MPKFELHLPRAYQAPPRRGLALVRAFALAAMVFGAAFGATFLLEPEPLASEAKAAPVTVAAAPCVPARLARHGPLVAGPSARATIHRIAARAPVAVPPDLRDPDAAQVTGLASPPPAPPGQEPPASAPGPAAEPVAGPVVPDAATPGPEAADPAETGAGPEGALPVS